MDIYLDESAQHATSGFLVIELIDSGRKVVERNLNSETIAHRIIDDCFSYAPWFSQGINVFLNGEMVATTEI